MTTFFGPQTNVTLVKINKQSSFDSFLMSFGISLIWIVHWSTISAICSHKYTTRFVCGTKMASPDLIKNAARWLVGYFSLIDVSEAWIVLIDVLYTTLNCLNNWLLSSQYQGGIGIGAAGFIKITCKQNNVVKTACPPPHIINWVVLIVQLSFS